MMAGSINESIDEKRARIKAERDALRAEVAARDKAREAQDALEAEERALANEMAIAKAEAEHGRIRDGKIGAIESRLGVVIVKRPTSSHYQRFMKGDPKKVREDADALVRSCIVHPSLVVFDSMLEEQPGLIDPLLAACVQLAGLGAQEVAGK